MYSFSNATLSLVMGLTEPDARLKEMPARDLVGETMTDMREEIELLDRLGQF